MSYNYATLNYIEANRGVWQSMQQSVLHSIAPSAQSSRARRPERKPELEFRQGSLFALARSRIEHNAAFMFAMVPQQADSADVILRTEPVLGSPLYERVQLKELVPVDVNPSQTIVDILESASRLYCTGERLTLAIHLNRDLVTTLGTVAAPSLSELNFWLYGLCGGNRGFIVQQPFGDFVVYEFDIPRAPSSMTQW